MVQERGGKHTANHPECEFNRTTRICSMTTPAASSLRYWTWSNPRPARRWILLGYGVVLNVLLVGLSGRLDASQTSTSDYERDLADVNRRLSEPAVERGGAPPATVHAAMLAEKALLTEESVDLMTARAAVEAVLDQSEPPPPFVALHAKLALQLHDARAALSDITWLEAHTPEYPENAGLRADLLIEAGEFTPARALCEAALRHRRDWPVLARLAQIDALLGQDAEAETLYQEAQDTLTVKQMRPFSWLEVQRGRLSGGRGKWDEADRHYIRAEQAYSGLRLVAASRAEAAGAQGKYAEGISRYQNLAEHTGRPEFFQALGDLYRYSGDPLHAKIWHERALAGYCASADRGEFLYLHHLAEFYADVRGDGEAALIWARRDYELRPGLRTRQTLAWALYRKGAIPEAMVEMTTVLASGLQNAHLFEQAARVNLAAGHEEEAHRWQIKAASLNPHYEGFHVHF